MRVGMTCRQGGSPIYLSIIRLVHTQIAPRERVHYWTVKGLGCLYELSYNSSGGYFFKDAFHEIVLKFSSRRCILQTHQPETVKIISYGIFYLSIQSLLQKQHKIICKERNKRVPTKGMNYRTLSLCQSFEKSHLIFCTVISMLSLLFGFSVTFKGV